MISIAKLTFDPANKRLLRQYIEDLIQQGKLWKFYKTEEWLTLKKEVLRENHNECVRCREKGRVTKAVEVHHVRYVRRYPELALSRTYTWKGKEYPNIIPLCHDCHDAEHERFKHRKMQQFNEERW